MSAQKTTFDWGLIVSYLALVVIGWMAIYSADFDPEHAEIYYQGRSYGRQFIFISFSLGIAFLIQIMDTRFYTAFAYIIYALAMLLLIATLFIGAEISGSKSWIRLGGGFNLQTAELAKFATCLGLAKYLSSLNVSLTQQRERIIAAAVVLLPAFLILLQGDAGSAVVFGALILVLYREGLSGGFLLLGVLMIILFIASLLTSYQLVLGVVASISLLILLRQHKFSNNELFIVGTVLLLSALFFYYVPLSPLIIIGLVILEFLSLLAVVYLRKMGRGVFEILSFLLVSLLIGLVIAYQLAPVTALIIFAILGIGSLSLALAARSYGFGLITFLVCCTIYIQGVDYLYQNILEPHQQNRIAIILGLVEDNRGIGYNLNQSKIAIGSGGIWGKGFLQGTQNKGSFVPELNTDFIFCTLGEEFGFMGSVILIGLFIFMLMRVIEIAERQQSKFSRVYGYGVASIIFCHFAINLGMTMGLVPVIGIPLPFISYGGSSLIGFTILVFILVKLDSERLMYLR